jgi:hypothetical protein
MLEEAEVTCPCCWETVVLDVDLSAGSQTYTEDCPVCCRPMTVRLRVAFDEDEDGEGTARFEVDVEPESD